MRNIESLVWRCMAVGMIFFSAMAAMIAGSDAISGWLGAIVVTMVVAIAFWQSHESKKKEDSATRSIREIREAIQEFKDGQNESI